MKKTGWSYLAAIMLMTLIVCATQCNFLKSDKTVAHDFVDLGLPSGTLWATGNYYDFGGCHDLEIDDPCGELEDRDVGRTIRPVCFVPIRNTK